ncbi:MAG: hypothetical protein ACFFBD_29615, partial [Candidatus Hodarchaeota archaeon]
HCQLCFSVCFSQLKTGGSWGKKEEGVVRKQIIQNWSGVASSVDPKSFQMECIYMMRLKTDRDEANFYTSYR